VKRRNVKYDGQIIQVEVGIPAVTKGLNDEWGVYVEYRSVVDPTDSQHEIYKFNLKFLKLISHNLNEEEIGEVLLDVFADNIDLFYSPEPWALEPAPIKQLILAQLQN
jgi:hypothetical protein